MKYRNKDINRLLGLVRLALPIHLTLIFLASFAGLWFDLGGNQRLGGYTDQSARYIVIDPHSGAYRTIDHVREK